MQRASLQKLNSWRLTKVIGVPDSLSKRIIKFSSCSASVDSELRRSNETKICWPSTGVSIECSTAVESCCVESWIVESWTVVSCVVESCTMESWTLSSVGAAWGWFKRSLPLLSTMLLKRFLGMRMTVNLPWMFPPRLTVSSLTPRNCASCLVPVTSSTWLGIPRDSSSPAQAALIQRIANVSRIFFIKP